MRDRAGPAMVCRNKCGNDNQGDAEHEVQYDFKLHSFAVSTHPKKH